MFWFLGKTVYYKVALSWESINLDQKIIIYCHQNLQCRRVTESSIVYNRDIKSQKYTYLKRNLLCDSISAASPYR